MRRWTPVLALALSALWLSAPAFSNPETGQWYNTRSAELDDTINFDETIQYTITANTDSALFNVTTPVADLCFDPDTSGAAGATRISVYRVVSLSAVTINASILLPSVPTDNSDCLQLVRALYWVEVTTGPSGGETPVVTVSGRASS